MTLLGPVFGIWEARQVGLEDHAELFFKEVGPVEYAVVFGDGGQGGALVAS
jgi:hypothetical protein